MERESDQKTKVEHVLENQIVIARSMGMENEIVMFLQEQKDWKRREWFYICALDGMTSSDLKKLDEEKATISQIRKSRIEFLKNLYMSRDDLSDEISKMKKEIDETTKQSDRLQKLIEENLEAALRREAESKEQLLEEKERTIQVQNEEILRLKKQLQDHKAQMQREEKKESQEVELIKKEKRTCKRTSFWKRKNQEKFLTDCLRDEKYTEEQIDFLLSCMEEEMDIRAVKAIASPSFSVPVMQRLKKLQEKEGERKDV